MTSRRRFKSTLANKPPSRRWLRGLLIVVGFTGVFFLAAAGAGTYLLYEHFTEALPDLSLLKSYQPNLITTVYADDETPVAQFFVERRVLIPLNRIPAMLKQATLAVEDARFTPMKASTSSASRVPVGQTCKLGKWWRGPVRLPSKWRRCSF